MTKRAKRLSSSHLITRIIATACFGFAGVVIGCVFAALIAVGMPAHMTTVEAEFVGFAALGFSILGGLLGGVLGATIDLA